MSVLKNTLSLVVATLFTVASSASFAEAVDPYALLRLQQTGFAKHIDLTPPPQPVVVPKKAAPVRLARTVTKKKVHKASKKISSKGRKWIDVVVDLSDQKMKVKINGEQQYNWSVSSGRKGHKTPTGTFKPGRMYKKYKSKKYYNSPMPNSIFFRGGYAIHGTFQTSALGYPASHGCVRLSPKNAKRLYDLIEKNGRSRTKIRIVN